MGTTTTAEAPGKGVIEVQVMGVILLLGCRENRQHSGNGMSVQVGKKKHFSGSTIMMTRGEMAGGCDDGTASIHP